MVGSTVFVFENDEQPSFAYDQVNNNRHSFESTYNVWSFISLIEYQCCPTIFIYECDILKTITFFIFVLENSQTIAFCVFDCWMIGELIFLFKCSFFLKPDLHEKGSLRQKGVGSLVSSQEQRMLLVPLIKRGWTADETRVNREFSSSIGLHRISFVLASGETFRRRFFDALKGTREACLFGEQFCWHPVLPDSAPSPRRAPRPDPPARDMSGFWTRQVGLDMYIELLSYIAQIETLSIYRDLFFLNKIIYFEYYILNLFRFEIYFRC